MNRVTLIRSKLLMPNPANLLHRPRVCQVIERGLERKLTLLSAPAGYGKTSALVDFARRSSVPVCWYTADERDRDLDLFIRYLVEAIRERFSGFGKRTQEALDSSNGALSHDPTAVVGELVNEMIDLDAPFAVVVDNYEALDGVFGVRTFVRRLLEVLPFNCHLMFSSRVLPDVPATRLVAKRQLVGLTDQNLRFDPQEIQALLRLSRAEISKGQAQAIAANSEGWITGVLLLAGLLRDGTALPAKQATVQTYDYLAQEVLRRQPPDVQHFLYTSAVLREMSSPLCREMLQIERPHILLTEVERRNLFVTRFGENTAATYRYHNLFRDFLHEQLRQRNPTRRDALHLRAAKRFERTHDVEEAIYHYLAAGAFPEAAALMEQAAMEWFTRGQVETLLRWAETLPEESRARTPWLSFYQSRVLTDRYDFEGARRALAHAEAGFAEQGDTPRLARIHNQRATLRMYEGRYKDVLAEARVALGMLGQDETIERAEAQRLVGRAYVGLGRLAEGIAKLQEALALFRQFGSPYDVVNLLQDLALAFSAQGNLGEMAAYLNEALAIGRRLGAATQVATALNSLGWLHHARGEYRASLVLYEEGLTTARRGNDMRSQAYILVGMADLYRDVGVYERAYPLYDAGWQIAREGRPALAVYILAARADMYRWQGDPLRALVLLEEARRLAEEKGLDFEKRGLLAVAEGGALVESGEVEAGRRLLSDAVSFLEQRQAKSELARARFLLTRVHLLAGDRLQAATELRQAMSLADEIGTRQFAVAEGQHAEELLELGISRNVPTCRAVAEEVRQLQALAEELAPVRIETEDKNTAGRLEIYALGGGRVVRNGHPVPASDWQAASARELFFYLLLHGPSRRDAVGLVFWPDLSAKSMANNFHNAVHRVRRAVGTDAVVVEDRRYRLGDVDYWFDVEEFEKLVERARLLPPYDYQAENLWQRAVALYGGDFLPEVERLWCVPKREKLREMYVESLIGVGRCYEARSEFEEAVGWYRKALELDEWREEIHRRIMRCYDWAGRYADALAQYHSCQEVLRRELDAEPSGETMRLYEEISRKGAD